MNWYETWIRWPVLFLAGYGIHALVRDMTFLVMAWMDAREMDRDRRRDGFR